MTKGRKHLTRAEIETRLAKEVKAPAPKTAKSPQWLPQALKKDFRALGKILIDLGIYSELDKDTLGRYLVAQHQYLLATEEAEQALAKKDVETADRWGRIQERYVKQARNHANDLGLTITSRCRLVVPQQDEPEENAFEKLMRERMKNA